MQNLLFTPLRALLWLSLLLSAWANAEHPITQHQDIVWASPEGFELTLDIAVAQTDTRNKPVLVIFHGGAWLINNKSIMTQLSDAIASRTDIITVNVNYRLLADNDNSITIDQLVEDAMGAVLWVKDNIHRYGGDANKIAITGDSAGGHLAAMVALAGRNLSNTGFEQKPLGFKPTYLPEGRSAEQLASQDGLKVQAVILSYAVFNMVEAAPGLESKDNMFWQWAGVAARGLFGDSINLSDNLDYYQAVSPTQYLTPAAQYPLPPQFVLVGEQDTLTTPASAQQYVEQLAQLEQPARITIYPGKGHGFLDSGCSDYNNGCFKEVSEPTVSDMIAFLNEVFELQP